MKKRFEILETPLADLYVVQRLTIGDNRGYLERLHCSSELEQAGITEPVCQINRTLTKQAHTVRGLHFQFPPHAETKLISCLSGSVFDVAVDLRKGSATFLQWYGEILSGENHRSMVIPKGFAHGFQTLTDNCEMLYMHTAPYAPEAEGGFTVADESLNISWPQELSLRSERDMALPQLPLNWEGIEL